MLLYVLSIAGGISSLKEGSAHPVTVILNNSFKKTCCWQEHLKLLGSCCFTMELYLFSTLLIALYSLLQKVEMS